MQQMSESELHARVRTCAHLKSLQIMLHYAEDHQPNDKSEDHSNEVTPVQESRAYADLLANSDFVEKVFGKQGAPGSIPDLQRRLEIWIWRIRERKDPLWGHPRVRSAFMQKQKRRRR